MSKAHRSSAGAPFSWLGRLGAVVLVATIGAAVLPTPAFGSAYQSVTFFENINSLDQTVSSQTSNTSTALTLFTKLVPAFANPGYSFNNWNTTSNGSGTSFSNGAIYNFPSGDMTLYAQWIENSVTFFENNSGSDTVHANQPGHVTAPLTLFSSLSPTFNNSGYTFAGWTTNANGSGTSYANGASYDFTLGSLSLYAQWVPIVSLSVNFASNGGSGSVASMSGLQGSLITLPSASTLSYSNYSFTGWNTSSNGSGIAYGAGASLALTTPLTLYAQWTPNVFAIVYNAAGGAVTPASTSFTFGSGALTLPTPILAGRTFQGWFSALTGGTLFGTGGIAFTPGSSLTLYAQWALNVVTVSYNAGAGTVTPTSATFSFGASPLTLPTPSLSGQIFAGWFSAPAGGTLIGMGGAAFSPSASTELFAQWLRSALVTVTFNANGGGGGVKPMSGTAGSIITVPGVTGLAHPGFTLVKWNSKANGTGTSYRSGATLALTTDETLFAQWTGHSPAKMIGAVGSFSGLSTIVTSNLKSQTQRLALVIKQRKFTVVTLYGYSMPTGLSSRNFAISQQRANTVATYLRTQLNALHVRGVTIRFAGEGTLAGASNWINSRVEVMVY